MQKSKVPKYFSQTLIYPAKDLKWLFPGLICWATFFLIPFGATLVLSFRISPDTGWKISADSYLLLFQDSYFGVALRSTLLFYGPAICLTGILGLLSGEAFFLLLRRNRLLIFALIPFFMPAPSLAVVWNLIGGSGSALVKTLQPDDEIWKYVSLLLLFLWKNTGIIVTIYLIAMRSIDGNILDAARSDGAKEKEVFFRIQLPLLKHATVYVFLYLMMCSVRFFREVYLLYGAYPPSNLFFIQHYMYLFFARLDYSRLSAAGFLFSISMLAIAILLFGRRGRKEVEI